MLNNISLCGRTTREFELKYIGTGTAVATNTIAVERDYKNKNGEYETDFINIEVFGKSAEFASNYIEKGNLVTVNGSLRIDKYEKDGQTVYYTKVNVASIQNIGKTGKSSNTGEQKPKFETTGNITDDEVPF